jgi:ASC-1-like (ASCH) protein
MEGKVATLDEVVLKVDEPWFTHIREGRKTVEGRKMNTKWLKFRPGCRLTVTKTDGTGERITVEVTEISYHAPCAETVEMFLAYATLDKALPGVETVPEGVAIYNRYLGKNHILVTGMIGIHLRVVQPFLTEEQEIPPPAASRMTWQMGLIQVVGSFLVRTPDKFEALRHRLGSMLTSLPFAAPELKPDLVHAVDVTITGLQWGAQHGLGVFHKATPEDLAWIPDVLELWAGGRVWVMACQ